MLLEAKSCGDRWHLTANGFFDDVVTTVVVVGEVVDRVTGLVSFGDDVGGDACASDDEATEGDAGVNDDEARTDGALGAGKGVEFNGEAGVVGFDAG